jgi:glutathione S-transferase
MLADEQAAARKKLTAETLPEKFAHLCSMMGDVYCVQNKLTMADIHLYTMCNWLGMEVLDGVPKSVVSDHPKLLALCGKINEIPEVKAWNEANNKEKVPWF